MPTITPPVKESLEKLEQMDLKNENLYRANTHSRTPVPTYIDKEDENGSFGFTLHNKEFENISLSEDKKFLDNLIKESQGGGEINKVNEEFDCFKEEEENKENDSFNIDPKTNNSEKIKEKVEIANSFHEENISKNDDENNRNEGNENMEATSKNKSNSQEEKSFPISKNKEREKSCISNVSERKMSKFSYLSEDKILKISLKVQENLIIDSFPNVPSQDQELNIVKSAGDVVIPTDRENYLAKKTVGTRAYSDNNIKPYKISTPSVEIEQTKNKGFSAASVSVAMSGVSVIRTEESKTEKTEKTEGSKTPKRETTNSLNFKVGPDIFISMKKGKFSKHYEMGKTLGEGKAISFFFFLYFVDLLSRGFCKMIIIKLQFNRFLSLTEYQIKTKIKIIY